MEDAIEIRLDARSLAAIESLTAAVNRVADEMSQDDDTDVIEPAPVRTDAPEVSVWQT